MYRYHTVHEIAEHQYINGGQFNIYCHGIVLPIRRLFKQTDQIKC